MFRKAANTFLLAGLLSCGALEAAQLSAESVIMQPGATDAVVVSGNIAGEASFGVTIQVEIVPRIGNTGMVTFTPGPPAAPVDVVQLGDPWPTSGTFDTFDTDLTSSDLLNGSVDDDGNFECTGPSVSVTFNGPLTDFPVVASADADGVWDVRLSTSAGPSLWQCVTPTTLIAGTITVIPGECIIDTDCNDTIACTQDTCVNANCVFTPNDANCVDDGFFCTGSEVCDPVNNCVSTGNPCQPGEFCNDATAACDQCQVDLDCDDGVACTDDTCVTANCLFTTNDGNCTDDGLFCTGDKVCDAVSGCVSTGSPCLLSEVCDDVIDACTTCTIDIDCDDGNVCTDDACNAGACVQTNNTVACDDGLFCTATDVCSGGGCVGSQDPCAGLVCDDKLDACLGPTASLTAVSLQVGHGANVSLIVAGEINGFDTFGVTLSVELVPRAGTTGTVQFTPGPPSDILQIDDAWPGAGTFTSFDTNVTGSVLLNGVVDDNGTFEFGPVSFNGNLAAFPVSVSDDAGGTWDILLSTSAGDSGWEGVVTTLAPGTVIVEPPVGLLVNSFAMPPDATTNVIVSGVVDNQLTFGFTALVELVPRAGTTGSLTFTPAPPADIFQIDDVWPGLGVFSVFDTDSTTSPTLNGCLDDNGTFEEGLLNFRGDLAGFPLVSSFDADGVWDLTLSTNAGNSSWEGLTAVLIDGTITVTAGACLVDTDCDDTNVCTDDVCVAGVCAYSDNTSPCDDGDQCTSGDTCALGVCVGVPILEGSPCDDGNLCAINDVCIGGVCAGTPVDCSFLDSVCGVGTCNATTGLCEVSPINEGGACDDGSLCTQNDVCTGGVCGGTLVDCTSLDTQCLLGSCDPATGLCQAVPLIDTTPCDDGDLCTENDACTAGACSGSALDCSSLDAGCIVGACNATTGVCESVAVNEGDPCNDGVACTVGDTCTGGVCAGAPKDCTALDSFCGTGTCNVVTGVCERIAINEGLGCDDGFTCTTGDQCTSGFCTGTLIDPPTIDLTLSPLSPTVQSGDTIQVDLIASSGTCADQPTASIEAIIAWDPTFLELTGKVDNSASWPDSEFPDDSALDGLNAPFDGLPGNDGDGYYLAFAGFSLANASFVPASGQLVASFQFLALDGALSTPIAILPSAGLFTTTRALLAGSGAGAEITGALSSASVQVIECQAGGDCSDGNVCTDDVCTNGICSNVNNIAPCDDGLFCMATDTCANGVCGGVGDPCTAPQLCSEGLDACVECLSNPDCVDGNVCTTDTCDALGACVYTNNTVVCDDGLFCTATDRCSGGGCVGVGDRCPGQLCNENADACVDCLVDADCDDGNLCTDETCNTVTGVCEFTNNTVPCNDGLFCTATDTCSNGACVGSGDPCPGQMCSDNVDACVECLLDSNCVDGNTCTDDDCIAGTCVNLDNTDPCDDGVFCTANDVCNAGACVGSGDPCPGLFCDEGGSRCVECFADPECDDAIACTVDQCDFAVGVCRNSPDDPFCDDGTFCNGPEVCSTVLGCRSLGSPCGNPDLCDEVNDRCDCEVPTLVAEGPRYLGATPGPGSTALALLLTGDMGDPNVACVSLYVLPDGTLSTTPVFQAPGVWGTVHIADVEIHPGTTYTIQSDCRPAPTDPQNLSNPASATTWAWGDVDNDADADFTDIGLTVDGFRDIFIDATEYATDLLGCLPNRQIDFTDIGAAVDAFKSIPFSCASPCP